MGREKIKKPLVIFPELVFFFYCCLHKNEKRERNGGSLFYFIWGWSLVVGRGWSFLGGWLFLLSFVYLAWCFFRASEQKYFFFLVGGDGGRGKKKGMKKKGATRARRRREALSLFLSLSLSLSITPRCMFVWVGWKRWKENAERKLKQKLN